MARDFEIGQVVVFISGGNNHVGPVEVGIIRDLDFERDSAQVSFGADEDDKNVPCWLLKPISNWDEIADLI